MASVCHTRVVRVYPQILNISNYNVANENDNFAMANIVNIYDSFSRICYFICLFHDLEDTKTTKI